MILILSDDGDLHADHVEEKLRRRGVNFFRFDPGRVPSNAKLSLAFSAAGETQYTLYDHGGTVDLSAVQAVWYRRPASSIPHEEITDQLTRDYIVEECKILMQDAWNSMDCFWAPA